MNQFDLWKKQALEKIISYDKSHVGSIDEKIQSLCTTINNCKDLFTLSSCSGRIALQKKTDKKTKSIWEFVTHLTLSKKELQELLEKNYDYDLDFVQEAAILHVCVKTNEIARTLMHIAKESGFNQVGIIANKTKIVVELICDAKIILPIISNNKNYFSEEYLEILVERANENQKKSWKAIEKLEEKIYKTFSKEN
jgi:tRNA wybutosine-synthesizing protein 3